jgi:hypothetical protein
MEAIATMDVDHAAPIQAPSSQTPILAANHVALRKQKAIAPKKEITTKEWEVRNKEHADQRTVVRARKAQFAVDAASRVVALLAMEIQAKANIQLGLAPIVAEVVLILKWEALDCNV